jgi:hypothetical protein
MNFRNFEKFPSVSGVFIGCRSLEKFLKNVDIFGNFLIF